MRRLLLIVMLLWGLVGMSQDATVNAFLKSYEHESVSQYNNAINELLGVYDKDSYSLNLRLGWLYYLNKNYISSKAYYKKAIEAEPRSIEARIGLAYPIIAMQKWNDAVAVYLEVLKIEPYNFFANYQLGNIYYYYLKDNEKALKHMQRVTKVYPFDYSANYQLALINISLGNIMEARKAIKLALEYNPSSKAALAVYETVK